MAEDFLNAATVAQFLSDNPGFFEDNAALFANLKVPHPYKSQAISLGERQILTLRARLKNSEAQLQNLVYNASGNQKINYSLIQWCAQMLAEENASNLPAHIVNSLKSQFDLDIIALKLWQLAQAKDSDFSTADPEVIDYINGLQQPYCGMAENQAINSLLDTKPASVAIIPLYNIGKSKTIGTLVFGSNDAERFSADLGTDFLQLIADLSGAALSRLDSNN